MSHQPNSANAVRTVALFAPVLQGLYIGELINQCQQLGVIKGYHIIVIRTGSYGAYNEPLHLDTIDAAIIVRNAVSPDLIQQLIDREIACVSIAFDYFPLKIPFVVSDHVKGVSLAMDHLMAAGHQKIAFVGDLRIYDIRKRFECYCELHETHNLPLRDDYLIKVDDALFSGGIIAANHFIEQGIDATGVIFGSGLTGIGFIQHFKSLVESPPVPAAVCFDALPMIPVFTPEMSSIDQNLHLIAYRAFNAIDEPLDRSDCDSVTVVTPKLTRVSDDPADRYDAFIATCADLPELHNSNYIKAVLANIHDWPREIVASNLDELMSIAPLYRTYMCLSTLSRYYTDTGGLTWLKIIRIFGQSETVTCELLDHDTLCRASEFPPTAIRQGFKDHDTVFHLPVRAEGKIWGLLSFFGDSSRQTPASSYYGFSGYIESIASQYEQQLEIRALRKRLNQDPSCNAATQPMQSDPAARIEWTIDTNQTLWSEAALAMFGFVSPVELDIYRYMELTDRLHPEDLEKFRETISAGRQNNSALQLQVRYRNKSGQYVDVALTGRIEPGSGGKSQSIIFNPLIVDLES